MTTEKEYTTPCYVALPISDVEVLDKLAEKQDCSRADLIRKAVENFLEKEKEEAKPV